MFRSLLSPALLCLLALATVGCGDFNAANGEFGRLRYSLHSDYLVDDVALDQIEIITRHQQSVYVRLTDAGDDLADNPEDIVHQVVSGAGTADTESSGDDEAPDLRVTGDAPGELVVESRLDGELFDRITLNFDEPVGLELLTWLRPRNGDDFVEAQGATIAAGEGAQAAFVPVPLDATGTRLAGDFDVTTSADPEHHVAFGENVLGVYEQNVWHSPAPTSVYFIEPGPVTVSLTDEANGVTAGQAFDVEAVLPNS